MKHPPTTSDRYKLGHKSKDGSIELYHLDGVAWHKAPIPRRWHRCHPQTWGYVRYLELVQRCACGAIRMSLPGRGMSHWMDRNSSRRAR